MRKLLLIILLLCSVSSVYGQDVVLPFAYIPTFIKVDSIRCHVIHSDSLRYTVELYWTDKYADIDSAVVASLTVLDTTTGFKFADFRGVARTAFIDILTNRILVVSDSAFIDTLTVGGVGKVDGKLVVMDSTRIEEGLLVKNGLFSVDGAWVLDTLYVGGNTKLDGNLDVTGFIKYNFVHAFMFKTDTTITPDCDGVGVYVKVVPKFVEGYGLIEDDGITVAPTTGDSLTIVYPGDYFVTTNFTMVGSNAIDYSVAWFLNSVKQYGMRKTTTGENNYSSGSMPFYFRELVAGDDICIKVANLTLPGTADPVIVNIDLVIWRIPE